MQVLRQYVYVSGLSEPRTADDGEGSRAHMWHSARHVLAKHDDLVHSLPVSLSALQKVFVHFEIRLTDKKSLLSGLLQGG